MSISLQFRIYLSEDFLLTNAVSELAILSVTVSSLKGYPACVYLFEQTSLSSCIRNTTNLLTFFRCLSVPWSENSMSHWTADRLLVSNESSKRVPTVPVRSLRFLLCLSTVITSVIFWRYSLMTRCWNAVPEDRPSFTTMLKEREFAREDWAGDYIKKLQLEAKIMKQ